MQHIRGRSRPSIYCGQIRPQRVDPVVVRHIHSWHCCSNWNDFLNRTNYHWAVHCRVGCGSSVRSAYTGPTQFSRAQLKLSAIVPLYNGETAPKALRGMLLVLYQLQIIIGCAKVWSLLGIRVLIYFQDFPELHHRPRYPPP